MDGLCTRSCFLVIIFSAVLWLNVLAQTDDIDAQVLRDMYKALNKPIQLKDWKSDGGDPCGESWTGVSCDGSTAIYIDLHGLGITGNLGFSLLNLRSLKQLDLSSNNFQGEIPGSLPLNITHLNLANNNFSQNIPHTLTYMKHLRHLNLSHNALSGVLGDVFNGLEKMRDLDLSYNNFSGDLPSSFGFLKSLTRLLLQGNRFTGSVSLLGDLPLSELNVEDNHFSGVIPEKFQYINNLWIGGNRFDIVANSTPWKFPFDVLPNEQNIKSPPASESSAFEHYPTPKVSKHKKGRMGGGQIVGLVGGGTLLAACAALVIVIRIWQSQKQMLGSPSESGESSLQSLTITMAGDSEDIPYVSELEAPPAFKFWHLPPVNQTKSVKVPRRSFSRKHGIPISAKLYTVAELQLATNNFNEGNLLGEGSLGSVYRGKLPDGQILAVKLISTVQLSLTEEEQFLDVTRTVSRLRHPNIVALLGYCVEHGQHLLIYEYIRNLSLDDALHGVDCTSLSWGIRLRISLGVARALNYLHSSCMPPIAHSNLKAANVLLNEDFRPCISDCGLSVLRPLTSNRVKLKASEMAIADSGYIAPEHFQTGTSNIKADIYAFGVLLLELLTGKQPFDSSRPAEEQYLAKWASCRLHDREFLVNMVDPAIEGMISVKDLSRFADIISLCVQPEKEFRPPMADIVKSLMYLLHKHAPDEGNNNIYPFDGSFRSNASCFMGSPTLSYYSI
ncbi:hypothetical protein M9H77_11905 [Catharanthus roseus]|uniref:Uncharacterized protein n=1 Tax=Catharanthus roseus TaxID=4058 RepID=A0ACC0BFX5_CATRO|nr:hypothetical protein M9H77_11905 [Catharanthus roseus]